MLIKYEKHENGAFGHATHSRKIIQGITFWRMENRQPERMMLRCLMQPAKGVMPGRESVCDPNGDHDLAGNEEQCQSDCRKNSLPKRLPNGQEKAIKQAPVSGS